MATSTIAELLAGLLAADSSRPLVTFYDDATGERVELSVKSFDNWVAKTANLLTEGWCATLGERLAISLPTHWQGMVWLCAAWSCGLVVRLDDPHRDEAADYRLTELEASDSAVEVAAYADVFYPPEPVSPDLAALETSQGLRSQADLLLLGRDTAARMELGAGPRLLTDANPCSLAGIAPALLAPMVTGGSVVLVRNADPARETSRVRQEQVTARMLRLGEVRS